MIPAEKCDLIGVSDNDGLYGYCQECEIMIRTWLSLRVVMTQFPGYSVLDLQSLPKASLINHTKARRIKWSIALSRCSCKTELTYHENIARPRYIPALPQQLQQIPKLPMYITTYCHRTTDRLNIRLFHQYRSYTLAKQFHFRLREVTACFEGIYPSFRVVGYHCCLTWCDWGSY